MWTWSIACSGSKQSVLDSLSSQFIPTTETDGEGNVITKAISVEETTQFETAKLFAIGEVSKMADASSVLVGISGNAETYKPTILKIS